MADSSETERLMNGLSNIQEDEDETNGEIKDENEPLSKKTNSMPNGHESNSDLSTKANQHVEENTGDLGKQNGAQSPSATASPDTEVKEEDAGKTVTFADEVSPEAEDKKDEDISKTVTFADDIEVYDLSNKEATPITVSLDKPVDYTDEQTPEGAADASKDGVAILPVHEEHSGSHTSPTDIKSSEPRPSELTLPPSDSHHGGGSPGQHRRFEVSDVDNSELKRETDDGVGDAKGDSSERPLLQKIASTISDGASGHSHLSTNQDTIGPLDNPSFLKRLQYSVSQAVEDDGGFGGTSNLDLANFQGAPPASDLDGGWAWVVLFAAFFSLSLTGATTFTAGVLMSAILENIDPDIAKASWIGAVHVSVMCMSGPFVGTVLNRLGSRWTSFFAGIVLSAGLVAASFATSVVQLIFTHGLIAGLGSGFILNTMFVSVGQYFNRYRGLACGLLATGSGAGMLAGGNALTALFTNFGLSGTYLLWGGVCLHTLIFAMLLRPSPEERLREAEKKMLKDPNLVKELSQHDLPSGGSYMSGLNSVYSSDQHSIFSGRTNYSRKFLQRYPSRLSKPDLGVAPLLKTVLHKEMSRSTHSIRTNRSRKSQHKSNTNLPSSPTTQSKFTFGPAPGQQDNLSTGPMPSPGTTPVTNSPLVSSPLAQGDQPSPNHPSPKDRPNSQNMESTLSSGNIAAIPEDGDPLKPEPPSSPTSSRGHSEVKGSFRRRYLSGVSQTPSYYTSIGRLSHRPSIRDQLQRNDLDNESLASTLVSHLQPKDALTPRYRLGSRSISAMMGSIASFPTALAIVKDDLARVEGPDLLEKRTIKDHLIGLLDSLRLLRNKPFLTFIITWLMTALGDSAFAMYLPAYAITKGSTPLQASSLYTGLGFGSMCGRFLSGLVASDSGIGPILLHIGCLGVGGLIITFSSLTTSTYMEQMFTAGIYGLYSGSLVPLSSLITIELLGIGELGLGFGFLSMFQGIGYLAGPPLGGMITKLIGYGNAFVFAGIVLIAASVLSMMIAILLRNAGEEEEDIHDSFDDLERALRRISDTESDDGSSGGEEPSDDDHHARKPFHLGSFHGSHHQPGSLHGPHHHGTSFHGASFKKKEELPVVPAAGDAPSPSETTGEELAPEPIVEETSELETIAEEA